MFKDGFPLAMSYSINPTLEEANVMTDSLNFSKNNGDVYYVYPRIVSFMDSSNITVADLAEKAGISQNTVSKIRSGLSVGEKMIDKCKIGLKSLGKDFDFNEEKMSAQGHYDQQAVKDFIGNRPWQEAATELGIEKHMLEWIKSGKKVSEEFHRVYIANKLS